MIWTKPLILRELKRLHKAGADLSYNALARKRQPLVSAGAYHFGSYRRAVERAGIDYADVLRRPRWTRQQIITLIKAARRAGQDLHWSAVTKRNDELSRAAFASLQPRLFGRWARALHAAGLDADDVSRYRAWDKNTVLLELKQRRADGEALSSAVVQDEDPALHAAAVRHFKTYDNALRGAKIDPSKVRRRRTAWDRQAIVRTLRSMIRKDRNFNSTALRKADSSLHVAAIRIFGSFAKAKAAAR